jgi:hypothetical protein
MISTEMGNLVRLSLMSPMAYLGEWEGKSKNWGISRISRLSRISNAEIQRMAWTGDMNGDMTGDTDWWSPTDE